MKNIHTGTTSATIAAQEQADMLEEQIPHLRRYARFLTKNFDQADDMVQDCLLRAIQNFDKWEPGTNLRAWLIVILRNNFYNQCRRGRREQEVKSDPSVVGTGITPAAQEDALSLDELAVAFGLLSGDHREVIYLIAMDGMSYEDAAGVLGINVGTVKSRLSRARTELRRILDGEGEATAIALDEQTAKHDATDRRPNSSMQAAREATASISEHFERLLRATSRPPNRNCPTSLCLAHNVAVE
jgi:RNA polymerase sigma-70 factor (ECF subfamily)